MIKNIFKSFVGIQYSIVTLPVHRSFNEGRSLTKGLIFFIALFILWSPAQAQFPYSYRLFVLDFENRNPGVEKKSYIREFPRIIFSQASRLPEIAFFPGTEYEYFQGRRDDLQQFPGDLVAPENVTLMGSYKNNAESQLLDLNLQFVLISPYKLLANVACTVDPRNPDTMADIIIKKIASVLKIEALSADVLNEEIPEINIDKELMGQLDKEMKELQNSMAGLGQRYDSLAIYESGTGKIGSSYYRKLASTDAQIDLEIDNMNRSTLKNAVYEILFNPYVAEIAEPDYIHYPYNPKNMTIILDVAYSLQEELIKDVVELLPFRIYKSRSKNYDYMSFKAKYNDIPFQLRREIQRGDYRVIPVLRFIDKYNKVQHIIVDEKYGELSRPKNAPAPLSVMNQFSQQLTLTASTSSVQLYLKEGQQVCNYRIDMPVSIVENLDRIVVDFIKINEFESWLGKLK